MFLFTHIYLGIYMVFYTIIDYLIFNKEYSIKNMFYSLKKDVQGLLCTKKQSL